MDIRKLLSVLLLTAVSFSVQTPQASADEETCASLFFDDGEDYADLTYLDVDGKAYGAGDDEVEGGFTFANGKLKRKVGATTYDVVLKDGQVRITASRVVTKKVRKKLVKQTKKKVYAIDGDFDGIFLRHSGPELIEGYVPGVYLLQASAGAESFGTATLFPFIDDDAELTDGGTIETEVSVDSYPCSGGEEEE